MDIILLNILNAQITRSCNDIELNRAYLLRKLTRAYARALVCDYKPESLTQLKKYTFATSIQLTTMGL